MTTSSANALYLLNKPEKQLALGAEALSLTHSNLDGKGGFKTVYGLPDGRAIALPNITGLKFKLPEEIEAYAASWERATGEEKAMADKFRAAGLEAQQIEIQLLTVGDHQLPVLVMPRFATLAKQGLQVRDVKNDASSCGHSMFFGTIDNLHSVDRLKLVMQGLADDTALILSHGLPLMGGDGFNIVVKDTKETPPHNREEAAPFDVRKQQIRGFFFDFASKGGPRSDEKLPLLDARGAPNVANIREYAQDGIQYAYRAMRASITYEEMAHIYGLDVDKDFAKIAGKLDQAYDLLDKNFTAIQDALVEAVTRKTFKAITSTPMEERLSKFSQPAIAAPGHHLQQITNETPGPYIR